METLKNARRCWPSPLLTLTGRETCVHHHHAHHHSMIISTHRRSLQHQKWCNRCSRPYLPSSSPSLQEKKTPLHIGAQKGREAVCKVLIDHKADVNILDKVTSVKSYCAAC